MSDFTKSHAGVDMSDFTQLRTAGNSEMPALKAPAKKGLLARAWAWFGCLDVEEACGSTGYLAHKKPPTPPDSGHRPTVGS